MTHPAPPYKLKRGSLTGQAARVYIPSRRGSRHYSDPFSRALFMSKKLPHYGAQYAHDMAETVAALVPAAVDTLASPPPGRTSAARGFYFARELTVAVAGLLDLQIARPLRWTAEGAESAKHTVSQAGKARTLAKQAECVEDLRGRRVAIIDDLFTTGITAQRTAEALEACGAEWHERTRVGAVGS